ncbi:hypothetical protein GF369_04260 [Candidatus Peregrinibacteria bacterium]|nr:hypothetical protein [Candidatus Peregrinibacteria bacterium]
MIQQPTTAEMLPVQHKETGVENNEPVLKTIKDFHDSIHRALVQEGYDPEELKKSKKVREIFTHLIRPQGTSKERKPSLIAQNPNHTTVRQAVKTVLNEE